MKTRMTRTILSIMLTLMMIMSLASTALAGTSIEFKGFDEKFNFVPGSEYTETDLFGNFKNVMPGDTVTEEITFTNSAADSDFINLYMRAVPHDDTNNPLSPEVSASGETVASMTDFLAQLSMKVWNGTQLIYEASPNELDGLQNNVLLGTFRSGDTTTLKVELSVPIELGNEYANRVGEVDWVFHVEAYNESQLTVRKVWADGNYNHSNGSVTVNLLKDGKFERSVELNAENQWTYTFDRLVEGHEWTVEEASVPYGYTVSYSTIGNTTIITNTPVYIPIPPINPPIDPTEDITVVKEWAGNEGNYPESVSVQLYRNDEPYRKVTLSEENDWTYTWYSMNPKYSWSVNEVDIPKDYDASYSRIGNVTRITNTYNPEEEPVSNDISLTVDKNWIDDNAADRPSSVKIALLKNGEFSESVILSELNNWTYKWDKLDGSYNWNVVETDVPDGYEVSYKVNDNKITVINTKIAEEEVIEEITPTEPEPKPPVNLSVKKVWNDTNANVRPDSVTVTLYDGETAKETVILNESNNWSYTWQELSPEGNWQVIEVNIPKGYTPSYHSENGVVTITNTGTLIQTGQLNWPIPVLTGLGAVLLTLGIIFIFRKKPHKDA